MGFIEKMRNLSKHGRVNPSAYDRIPTGEELDEYVAANHAALAEYLPPVEDPEAQELMKRLYRDRIGKQLHQFYIYPCLSLSGHRQLIMAIALLLPGLEDAMEQAEARLNGPDRLPPCLDEIADAWDECLWRRIVEARRDGEDRRFHYMRHGMSNGELLDAAASLEYYVITAQEGRTEDFRWLLGFPVAEMYRRRLMEVPPRLDMRLIDRWLMVKAMIPELLQKSQEALARELMTGLPMLSLVVQAGAPRHWIYTDDEGRAYVGLEYASAKVFADSLLEKTGIEGVVIDKKPADMAARLRHEGIERVCILLEGETVELPVAMLNPAPVGGLITQRNAPLRRILQRELQRACGQRAIKVRTFREAHLSHPTPPLLLKVVPELENAVLFVLVQGQEDAPVTRVTRSAVRAMEAEYAQMLHEPGTADDVVVLGALPPVMDMKTLIHSSPVYCAVSAFTSFGGAWAVRTEMKLPVAIVAATWREIVEQAKELDGLVIDRMTLTYPVLAIDM